MIFQFLIYLIRSGHFFVEKKANIIIKVQKCNLPEKHDRILTSKMEFKYQIAQRNKKFSY